MKTFLTSLTFLSYSIIIHIHQTFQGQSFNDTVALTLAQHARTSNQWKPRAVSSNRLHCTSSTDLILANNFNTINN